VVPPAGETIQVGPPMLACFSSNRTGGPPETELPADVIGSKSSIYPVPPCHWPRYANDLPRHVPTPFLTVCLNSSPNRSGIGLQSGPSAFANQRSQKAAISKTSKPD
jgi:hypothetical protein